MAKLSYEEIIQRLEELANPEAVAGMARFGITPKRAYGVTMPELRKLGKLAGTDHDLALRLWADGSREARILTSMVADPNLLDEALADAWVAEFDYWEICDQFCMNLFERAPFAYRKSHEWSRAEGEYVKRTGFVLMARLAVSDKKASDEPFHAFLAAVEREANDNRPAARKGINWALRQIGKRNLALNERAIATAEAVQRLGTPGARWIAADALRELRSEAVQAKLRARAAKLRGGA